MSFIGRLFNSDIPVDIQGMTDWHSHLLPGVDDGVKTIDESISILSGMEKAGIRKVWLTPHIMEDIPNTTEDLKACFKKLYSSYGGSIRLKLASENMIDGLFTERLAAGDLLPIGENSDLLLVETSYFNPPMNFYKTIENIKTAGYTPLVAHPERYAYVTDIGEYRRWKDMGCAFQLNLLSLGGHYSSKARCNALELLKYGMYDFAGSDIHRISHLESMKRIRIPGSLADEVARLLSRKDKGYN